MKPIRTLRVYANPYHVLDHEGCPCAAVPWDPGHNPDRGHVGVSERYLDPSGKLRFLFENEVITLPYLETSNYYRQRVMHGELIAVDEPTALLCGVKLSVSSALFERDKAAAEATCKAMHGGELPTDFDPYTKHAAVN